MEGSIIQNGQLIQILIPALLAAFGALARLLSQKDQISVKFAAMMSSCLVAAFAGVMAHFVSDYFDMGPNLAYVLAGISGWIGPQILDIIANFVLQRAGINPPN